jgi:hypothetical protein
MSRICQYHDMKSKVKQKEYNDQIARFVSQFSQNVAFPVQLLIIDAKKARTTRTILKIVGNPDVKIARIYAFTHNPDDAEGIQKLVDTNGWRVDVILADAQILYSIYGQLFSSITPIVIDDGMGFPCTTFARAKTLVNQSISYFATAFTMTKNCRRHKGCRVRELHRFKEYVKTRYNVLYEKNWSYKQHKAEMYVHIFVFSIVIDLTS